MYDAHTFSLNNEIAQATFSEDKALEAVLFCRVELGAYLIECLQVTPESVQEMQFVQLSVCGSHFFGLGKRVRRIKC